ncbi:MAG: hypothetical protein HUU20_21525 [Pirellulales bacterium]|nr:hypothetical protein [Pirellulales bacterium]
MRESLPVYLATVASLVLVSAARSEDRVQARGGLADCFRVLAEAAQAAQPARIVYLGGAFTQGQGAGREPLCYRALTTAHIRRLAPKTGLVEYDHSVAETGSWLAAFRASTDVVQHYLPLCLVVVELAAADGAEDPQRGRAALEGLVRQIRRSHPQADLLFVYACSPQSPAATWHDQIAEHYRIASVYAADAPLTEQGHASCAAAIGSLLEKAQAETADSKPLKHPLAESLCTAPMDAAKLVAYEAADFEPGWKTGQENTMEERLYRSAVGKFRSLLVCDSPGPTATLRFRGDAVGWFGAVGKDSGDLECSIDGGPWQHKACFQPGRDQLCPQAGLLADGLAPTAEHVLRIRVAEKTPPGSAGRTARIGYFLVNGTAADRYKDLAPLERIDAIYQAMESVQYTPPDGRWQLIPKTIQRLREGGTLRIVMLGDSIVNDTASSQYELLLERMYPKCKVVKIRSVRGSTGCWWYKEEGRVDEWVLKHEPDLLMIGGISQRDDTESIRAVIQQVRAARPQVEVMLLSPVFGTYDPRADQQWAYDADPQGEGYRSRLIRLAAEEKVEHVNMTGPWGEYLRRSDKARGWFMRDPVHANERGFQILGRILEKYFAPE